MEILALIGSPRKRSNTDILVDRVLQGSEVKGHTSEKLYLYYYEISPCIDCRNCKKDDYVCTVNDEMQKIYPKMQEADVIIFGTPLYWFGPSGKMKLLMDRMRPFAASRKLQGKRGALVVPSGEEIKVSGPLVEMFRLTFDYLGMVFVGTVLAQAYEKGEVEQNQEALRKAYEFGVSLT